MRLEYIREFVVLAEIGNYLQAADELFIAQSALSRHIQSLEDELGCKLFERTTHKIHLTDSGERFLPYARKILETQTEYREALTQLKNNKAGSVRIGCFPVADCYGIPAIISSFTLENPNISIDLYRDDDLADLNNKKIDLMFFRECTKRDDKLAYVTLSNDHLVAIVPDDHPLSNNKTINIDQLRNDRFLMLPNNTLMHKMCLDICKENGFEPEIAYSGSYVNIILELIKSHAGISLLTERPLSSHDMNGLTVLQIEPEILTPISLVYPKDAELSYGAQTFLDFIQKIVSPSEHTISQHH